MSKTFLEALTSVGKNLQSGVDKLNNTKVDYPVLASEGKTVIHVKYPYGDVRRYGAKGDGVTDDTKAIQNAINSGSKVIKLICGQNYYIKQQINVSNPVTIESDGSIDMTYGLWNPSEKFPSLVTDNTFSGDYVLYITANTTLQNFGVVNIYQTAENNYVPTYSGIYTNKKCTAEYLAIRGYDRGFITDRGPSCYFNALRISACIVCFFAKYTSDTVFSNFFLNTNTFMENFITPSTDFGSEKLVGFLAYGSHSLIGGKIEYTTYGVLSNSPYFNVSDMVFDWNKHGCYFTSGDTAYHLTRISNCLFMSRERHIYSDYRYQILNVVNCDFYKSDGTAAPKLGTGDNLLPEIAFTAYPAQDSEYSSYSFNGCIIDNAATTQLFSYTPIARININNSKIGTIEKGNITNLTENGNY